MGVVVRRYIDILTIIINFPYSTCISFFLAVASLLCSFLKCFFGLYIYNVSTWASLTVPFRSHSITVPQNSSYRVYTSTIVTVPVCKNVGVSYFQMHASGIFTCE